MNGDREKHHGKFGNMQTAENLTIFRGKKVFITGHTGFKGSWLVSWLSLLGAEIKGYALAAEHEHGIYRTIKADSLCDSTIADIRDEICLEKELLSFKPDFVFHLAAQPLVRLSYKKPTETFEVNVTGTANLLNAIRLLEKPCVVVVVTTDKVYENHEWAYPYREVDVLGGYDPYSASKACTEIVVNSFRQSFFNSSKFSDHQKSIASARAGNVIGGGDWSDDRIVPDMIRSLTSNKKILVRNPTAIRPWQFVLEPLYGYLLLAAALMKDSARFSGAYNFGPFPNDVLSVEQLVKQAINAWGSGAFESPDTTGQPHEAGILKLDISKSMDQLNWVPKLNSTEAVDWTMEWYKQHSTDSKEFTFEQINRYQSSDGI
jgi:CDP-glucose 4,6-dehydratase